MNNRTLFEKVEILFFVAVAGACLVTFLRVMSGVPLPYEIEFGEGPLLGIAARVAHGGSPYPDPAQPPYIISPYGPIPYYWLAALVRLFGVVFWPARLASVVAGICCALLIALLVHRATGSRMIGTAFGLLFLTRPILQDWLFVARVDSMGLAFSLTGLYCFARCRRWYVSAPFFIAGVLCKFVFLAAPLACLLRDFQERMDEGSPIRRLDRTAGSRYCPAASVGDRGLVYLPHPQRERQPSLQPRGRSETFPGGVDSRRPLACCRRRARILADRKQILPPSTALCGHFVSDDAGCGRQAGCQLQLLRGMGNRFVPGWRNRLPLAAAILRKTGRPAGGLVRLACRAGAREPPPSAGE